MLDKIANQKLFFISLIGIVVTSMILTTTFAYQSIRVNYSEGSDSELGVSAGVLDVKYCRDDRCLDPDNTDKSEEKYNKIDVNNLSFLPDYKTASYVEFVVDNRSSSDDVAYMITLSDLVYNKMFVSEAFKYTVVVVNDDGTLTEIITDNFSTLTGNSFDLNLEDRIYKYIEKEKTERVRIYLWLDENVDVQLDLTDTSERKFTGIVNVSSIFDSEVSNITENDIILAATKYIKDLINNKPGVDLNNNSSIDDIQSNLIWPPDEGGVGIELDLLIKNNYIKSENCRYVYKDELTENCKSSDLNFDGKVTPTDISLIVKYVGISSSSSSYESVKYMDLDKNNAIDIDDLTTVLGCTKTSEIILNAECKSDDEDFCYDVNNLNLENFTPLVTLNPDYNLVCE